MILELNKIKDVLLGKKIEPKNNIGLNVNLDLNQFFEKIRYSGDSSLLRSFDGQYSFGLYSIENNKFENYILIKLSNFDLAFQGILNWERYMSVDLKGIFTGNNEIISNNAEPSGISTSSEKKYYKKDTKTFIDRTLKNYDIREFVDNNTNTDIIYGFINNKFLLITSGESSFIDIKNRLLKENIVR